MKPTDEEIQELKERLANQVLPHIPKLQESVKSRFNMKSITISARIGLDDNNKPAIVANISNSFNKGQIPGDEIIGFIESKIEELDLGFGVKVVGAEGPSAFS